MRPSLLLLGLIAGMPVFSAWAARPFVTDDARITAAESCQLESWARVYPDSREFWVLPACNPWGNLELTLGGNVARSDGESTTHDYQIQFKSLIHPLTPDGWGIGIAAGHVAHPSATLGPNQLGNTYAYVPVSVSWHDGKVVTHMNVGWMRDKASSQDSLTWGVGSEFSLNSRWMGIVETYGDHRQAPYWQTGLRFSVIPDRFQLDASLGQQLNGGNDARWVSFGVRLTPEHLF